jgi:hypothetical protein
MMAVPEFSRSLLKKVGAPGGTLRTFIEVPLEATTGTKERPDGVLVVRRGSSLWRALVEVKTGTNDLYREQIEGYLDLARDHSFDAVITISNQMTTAIDPHPLVVDKRKTRKVGLYHWSWVEILSEAMIQREFRGVADPDQAWILGELIAYLQHPSSGALDFHDMGMHWVSVREAARDGTLRANDKGVDDVVTRWDQFISFLCLYLMRELGVKVTQVLPRAEQTDPAVRKAALIKRLVDQATLEGTIRVQNAAGEITLSAGLRSLIMTASVDVQAPNDGRPATRVNWLLRQLTNAPDSTRLDAAFTGVRGGTSCRLVEAREDSKCLLLPDTTRSPRSFTLATSANMGTKRGGTEGFIGQATRLLLDFYRTVVQDLRLWAPPTPKLEVQKREVDIADQPESLVEEVARRSETAT